MSKHDLILNSDTVVAHHSDGTLQSYRFGELKQMFIGHKILVPIEKLYLPRNNKYFKVIYNRTKGFKFEKIKN